MTELPMTLLSIHPLLAQEAAPPIAGPGGQPATTTTTPGAPGLGPQGQGAGQGKAAPPAGFPFMWFLLVMFLFLIGMQVFSGRKEKKKRAAMLAGVGRHDRVQTVGGLIATVSEVREHEIILKVDESTNTKIHVSRSAVQQVLKKAGESGPAAASVPIPEPEKIGA